MFKASHKASIPTVAFLGGVFISGMVMRENLVEADPPAPPSPPRVGYVDIARVLKNYDRASTAGTRLTTRRAEYLKQVKRMGAELIQLQSDTKEETDPDLKRQLEEKVLKLQREIQDIDRKAKAELTSYADASVIQIVNEVRQVIGGVAQQEGFDVVEIYPGTGKGNPKVTEAVIARMILQTPAGWPIYVRPEFDLTDEVIIALNRKYPAEKAID